MLFSDGSPAKSLFIDTSLTAIFYRCRWVGSCKGGVPFSEILVLTATRVFTIDPSRYEKTKTSPVMKRWEREPEKGGWREGERRRERVVRNVGRNEETKSVTRRCRFLLSRQSTYCRTRMRVGQPASRTQTMGASRCPNKISF